MPAEAVVEAPNSAVADVVTGGADQNVDQVADNSAETVDTSSQVGDAVESTDAEQVGDQSTVDAAEGDGRVIPQSLRKILDGLKATDPKTAKYLKSLFFADRALKEQFPGGVTEAVKAKQALDSLGGEEGLQRIEAERGEWAALDEQYSAGDPKFIENIATENPEAFGKMVPHALEQFSKLDAEGYQHTMARVFSNTLRGSGFHDALRSLHAVVKDNPEAAAIVSDLAGWAKGIDELAEKVPVKKIDPERQQLDKEKQEWQQEKTRTFQKSTATEVLSYMEGKIEPELGRHLKEHGVDIKTLRTKDPEAFGELVSSIDKRIAKALNADKEFLRQRDALLAEQNKDKILKLYRLKVDKLLPDAVKATYRLFYTVGGGKAATNQQRAAANGQRRDVGQGAAGAGAQQGKPAPKDIDYSRTTSAMLMEHKFFRKGVKEQQSWA